jgi:hypothetical protein
MKRRLCTGALVALAALTTACGVKVFEDIGSDPHPPTILAFGLAIYVPPEEPAPAPTTDQAASAARGRTITVDSGGFTVARGQKFVIGLTYSDAGGDIESFPLRDRDGSLKMGCVPADLTYFPGTSGSVTCVQDGYELVGINGPHRLEIWAEDSHLSRSEKLEFVITLVD